MSGPQFRNGRAPDSELREIAAGVPVWWGTANAWNAMRAASLADRIDLWPAGIASGYRSLFVQQDMHDHPALYDLNPASSVSLASAGNSTHGWGTRVDIGSAWGSRLTWLLDNAGRFGFSREFGSLDPNHFAHDGFTAINATASLAGGPTTPIEEDPFMTLTDKEQTDLVMQSRANAEAIAELKAVLLEGRKDIFPQSPVRETLERIRGPKADREKDPIDSLQDANGKLDALLAGTPAAAQGGDVQPAGVRQILEAIAALPGEMVSKLLAALGLKRA